MSWISDLYQTYEANKGVAAQNLDGKDALLLPVSHSTQNAQIEVTIDTQGDFLTAGRIPKNQAVTIIPVTEDSAGRTSGACAHPLEDKLEYVAGDFQKYTGTDNANKHGLYLKELQGWCDSAHSVPQIKAIQAYILKDCLISDLARTGVMVIDPETGFLTNDKIEGIAQRECFVRFTVDTGIPGKEDAVYRDKEMFEAYSAYYESRVAGQALCYVSGEVVSCSVKHGSKIRNAGDKAKLISANDSGGFTYRGRFADSDQALSVGYDVSQKAHSALRWLIQKQGFYIGEMAVVGWEITGKAIPNISKSSKDALFDEDFEDMAGFTNDAYARKLRSAVQGYKQNLTANTQVVLLGVEAATTGRLSVCFYHKMSGSDFIENIEAWYKSCFWTYLLKDKNQEGRWYWFIGSPKLRTIAETAFGNKNEKVIKSTMERLIPCIIDQRPLPGDIMKAAVLRVSNPAYFENRAAHLQAIGITCALIRKYRYDRSKNKKKKEDWNMALDRTETDRSYLFGRLLGAARKLEEVALYFADEKGRTTAAERYMQQFQRRPVRTWRIIHDSLPPYMQRLKSHHKTYYEKELQEIYELIEKESFMSNEPLSELYLLGYNCQMNSYKTEEEK